jgi:hypothetical protein
MALYCVHFVDHGNNVREARHIEHDSDDEAIEAAHRMNVSWIGAGFETARRRGIPILQSIRLTLDEQPLPVAL